MHEYTRAISLGKGFSSALLARFSLHPEIDRDAGADDAQADQGFSGHRDDGVEEQRHRDDQEHRWNIRVSPHFVGSRSFGIALSEQEERRRDEGVEDPG